MDDLAKKWIAKVNKLPNKTPFLAMDLNKVADKLADFKTYFPKCNVYYAVKAYGDDELIRFVNDRVSGFEISSLGEFETLTKLDVDPKRIIFSNPVKIPEHIAETYKKGLRLFSFDSHSELTKIAKYAPGSQVYLRIKVSDHGSAFPLSSKFGATIEHAVPLADTARSLGLQFVGITFHVGSQSESLQSWDTAIEKCGIVMKRLIKHDVKLSFINIGGGFPVRYTEKVPELQQIVEEITKSLKAHIPYEVDIYAEPGRFLVAEAGLMVATVIGREKRETADWLFLDVGAFSGLMEPLEIQDWKYPIFTEKSLVSHALPQYFITTGPTCDPYDTFGHNVPLPAGTQIGDKIFIGSAGAYTITYASTFNGFEKPSIVYV